MRGDKSDEVSELNVYCEEFKNNDCFEVVVVVILEKVFCVSFDKLGILLNLCIVVGVENVINEEEVVFIYFEEVLELLLVFRLFDFNVEMIEYVDE